MLTLPGSPGGEILDLAIGAAARPMIQGVGRLRSGERGPDRELRPFEVDVEATEGAAPERDRGLVVACHKRSHLPDPRGASVGEQLCGEGRADAAPLVLVDDLEGDLGGLPVADEAGDRDRSLVSLEVCDEDVARRVDRREVLGLGRAQRRLRTVETRAAWALAEPARRPRGRSSRHRPAAAGR